MMMMTTMNLMNEQDTTMMNISDEELQRFLNLATEAPQACSTTDFNNSVSAVSDAGLDALLEGSGMEDLPQAFFDPLEDLGADTDILGSSDLTDDDDSGFATDYSSTSDVEMMSPKSPTNSMDKAMKEQLTGILGKSTKCDIDNISTPGSPCASWTDGASSSDETDTVSEPSSDCEFSLPQSVQCNGRSRKADSQNNLNLMSPSQQRADRMYVLSDLSMMKPHPKVDMDPRSMVQLRNLDPRLQVIAAPRMDTGFRTRVDKGRASIHNPLHCDICQSNKPESRKRALHRYREKRARRNWKKNPRYCARSSVACGRKRVKGRFVRTLPTKQE